ncbi:MAG: CvpA family protein [Paludibacteraceae bacterium]|nr:CvpA family protein [Paludibacteraceae bacterium]
MICMDFCWLDIIILLPVFWGLVRGLMQGLISEVMAILAIILGCLGAYWWAGRCAAWLHAQWAWQPAVCNAVAYALIFIAIAVALTVLANLLSRLFKAINLGGINRLCGGLFGMAKWALVVLVVLFCVNQLDSFFHFMPDSLKSSSLFYQPAVDLANRLWLEVTC